MITPELTMKQKRVNRLMNYALKWNLEDYKYVGIDFNDSLIATNNLDCDGMRYFNQKSFINYIDRCMKEKE